MQSLCSSTDTSNWRLVQNPQHMWSHSFDFIFSNYYRCLVVYVSVVFSAYVGCSLWTIHTNTNTDTSTPILIWANDTIQYNHMCQRHVSVRQWHRHRTRLSLEVSGATGLLIVQNTTTNPIIKNIIHQTDLTLPN